MKQCVQSAYRPSELETAASKNLSVEEARSKATYIYQERNIYLLYGIVCHAI